MKEGREMIDPRGVGKKSVVLGFGQRHPPGNGSDPVGTLPNPRLNNDVFMLNQTLIYNI
jgi:hypothetical protein